MKALSLLVSLTISTSTLAQTEKRILGSWQFISGKMGTEKMRPYHGQIEYSFRADGTYTYKARSEQQKTGTNHSGVYELQGQKVILSYSDVVDTVLIIKLSEDKLFLRRNVGPDMTAFYFKFKRAE